MGDHVLGEPVGEVFVLRVGAQAQEWQHRDRRRTGGRRRGQRLRELGHGIEAVRRCLGERDLERLFDRHRYRGAEPPHAGYRVNELLREQCACIWAGVRRLAGKHLVQDARETVDIAARVEHPLAHCLLGAHVFRRPDHKP